MNYNEVTFTCHNGHITNSIMKQNLSQSSIPPHELQFRIQHTFTIQLTHDTFQTAKLTPAIQPLLCELCFLRVIRNNPNCKLQHTFLSQPSHLLMTH